MSARRIGMVLTLFVGTAIASATAVPIGGAATVDDVVRLHFGATSAAFTSGDTAQSISVGKNSCSITSREPLIDLSSVSPSGDSTPGFAGDGIGVKASKSSANGTPCAQVDSTEKLILRPGSALSGRSFRELRLDVEMTGNAIVVLTMSNAQGAVETHTLLTGTSIGTELVVDTVFPFTATTTTRDADATVDTAACATGSNSGPNSVGYDNCLWTVQPSIVFNNIELRTLQGTVSLEGSGDFGNNPDHDSLFYLADGAPVAVDDTVTTIKNTPTTFNVLTNDTDPDNSALQVTILTGPAHGTVSGGASGSFTLTPETNYTGTDSFTYEISDGTSTSSATVHITVENAMCSGDTVTDEEGVVIGSFTRLTDSESCKQYTLDAVPTGSDGAAVVFVPTGAADAPPVIYRGFVRLAGQTPPSGVFSLGLQYDRDGSLGAFGLEPVEWCDNPTFAGASLANMGLVTSASLPGDETWCIASETTVASGANTIVTTWQVYGEDDPRFQ